MTINLLLVFHVQFPKTEVNYQTMILYILAYMSVCLQVGTVPLT